MAILGYFQTIGQMQKVIENTLRMKMYAKRRTFDLIFLNDIVFKL